MGKKRSRTSLKRVPGGDVLTAHPQSLVDDVRQLKDVEFAALKKNADRSKRQKLAADAELEHQAKQRSSLKRAAKRGNVRAAEQLAALNPRSAGLKVWKDAAARRAREKHSHHDDEEDAQLDDLHSAAGVDANMSLKILQQAKEQRAEIRQHGLESVSDFGASTNALVEKHLRGVGDAVRSQAVTDEDSDADGEDVEEEVEEIEVDFLDASKITEDEEIALQLFSNMRGRGNEDEPPENTGPKIMLADIILEKLREKEEMEARAAAEAADPERAERNRKIAEVYGMVGTIMSRYRSGKVPKAFKVISMLPNWEELIYLTRPDEWSPAAVYVATRMLASNLTDAQVVRFYKDILLPRCLEDIEENKKLNYHLYRALAKALYKPSAFSQGILFPLCEDSACSLRQATIIGSVLAKVSIPMLHSAAALFTIARMRFSPPSCLIITSLLEKRYALPYRAVDAVVVYFVRMKTETHTLPLLWHKSLLSFAQRYKTELTMQQKEQLKRLMRVHTHHAVTAEIRRELFSSRSRGDLMDPDANTIAKNIADANAMVVG